MLDLVLDLGVLALDAYTAFANEEENSVLASSLGAGGALALGAGAFLYNLLSDEEREDGNNEDDDEIVNLLVARLSFARVCVSLWSHCCRADGELSQEEDELTDEMIGSLFTDDSLFPEAITNQEIVIEELINTFNDPLPMKVVVELVKDNYKLAANFYEEACIIFAVDGTIEEEEKEFLNDLADEFELSRIDKKSIEKKCLKIAIN